MSEKISFKWKILTGIEIILGLYKTIVFNFKYLPLSTAIKLPVLVSKNVNLDIMHGKVKIQGEIRTGMIKLGFGAFGLFNHTYEKSSFVNSSGGNMIFHGKAVFGPGFKIINNGLLQIGENFSLTGKTTIICENDISFGKNDLLSWDILIMDTDYHSVIVDEKKKAKTEPIVVGDKVWIGARSTVLKGSKIPNKSVIGAASVVSGHKKNQGGVIMCGIPARVIRQDIDWER